MARKARNANNASNVSRVAGLAGLAGCFYMAQEFINLLKDRLGDDVLETSSFRGDDTAVVSLDAWGPAIKLLKSEGKLDMLTDLSAADFPERLERFEVIAHLYSTERGKRFRVKTTCSAHKPIVPSITDLFCSANWFEREAFDLFGIRFEGHPNLKRILCHQKFEGHALRKDYPKGKRGAVPVPDTMEDEIEKHQATLVEIRNPNIEFRRNIKS